MKHTKNIYKRKIKWKLAYISQIIHNKTSNF